MALVVNKQYKQRRSDVELHIGGLYKTKLGKVIRLTRWVDIVNLPKEQDKIVEDLNRLILRYRADTYSLEDGTHTVIWFDGDNFIDIEGRTYWSNGDSNINESNVECLSESSELDTYKKLVNDRQSNTENLFLLLLSIAFVCLLFLPFYLFGS